MNERPDNSANQHAHAETTSAPDSAPQETPADPAQPAEPDIQRAALEGKPRHSLDEVLAAIEKGITRTGAAKVLGVSPVTLWRYAKRWKAVDQALREKRRELVDLAEMGLRGAVLRGEPWAIAFTLRTLGKDEGYTERLEHTGRDGQRHVIEVVYVTDANRAASD